MNDEAMVLDGNAAAGPLAALFAFDVTAAIIYCGNCDVSGPLAKLRLYGTPNALVLRCPCCGAVNLRMLKTGRTINLDLSGTVRIEIGSGT